MSNSAHTAVNVSKLPTSADIVMTSTISHHMLLLKVRDPWNQDIPTGSNMSTIWQRSGQFHIHRFKYSNKCSRSSVICQKPNLKHHQFSTQTICLRRHQYKMLCLSHRDQQAQWQESSVAYLRHFQKICAEIQQHIFLKANWKNGRKSRSLKHLYTARNWLLSSTPKEFTNEDSRISRRRQSRKKGAQ